MDREVIEQKLESLRKCLRRIETKCPVDAGALVADIDLQDIIALNLSRAVQNCVDIGAHLIAGMETSPPDTMGQTFDVLAQEGILNNELATNLKRRSVFETLQSTIIRALIGSLCITLFGITLLTLLSLLK